MKRLILRLSMILLAMAVYCSSASAVERISVSISPLLLLANMGDRVTYLGTITNLSDQPIKNILTYISLANVTPGKEAPMDLEDWNANKAIKVDIIAARGTYEGKWSLRLIDSGSYVAYITVVDKDSPTPISSTMSRLEIKRVLRLNPNNVLPVAIGEPVILGLIFGTVALKRKMQMK